jgi:hypothetical protein
MSLVVAVLILRAGGRGRVSLRDMRGGRHQLTG